VSSYEISFNKIIYVDDDGDADYTRIQDAINNASNGDTIFVFNGTYFENIVIDKTIKLYGEDKNNTIIDGQNLGNVITLNASRTSITDLKMRNSGMWVTDGGIHIKKNHHHNIIQNNIFISNYDGIFLEGTDNNMIFNNVICNNFGNGIWINEGWDYNNEEFILSKNNSIIGNIIENNEGRGIFLFMAIETMISENCISNNSNIGIMPSETTIIVKNFIRDNKRFGIYFSLNNITIIGNEFINDGLNIFGQTGDRNDIFISNNSVNGKPLVFLHEEFNLTVDYDAGQIIIIECENISISNLNLTNSEYGIILIDSNNCIISNNTIHFDKFSGISLIGCTSLLISDNIVSNSDRGLFSSYCFNEIISKNVFNNNNYGIYLINTDYSSIFNNILQDNSIGFYIANFAPFQGICESNNVKYNNFNSNEIGVKIENGEKNFFYNNNFIDNGVGLTFWNPYLNNFNYNYWDKPRYLPKLLIGTIGHAYFQIPGFAFDWHPAKEPYEI
jgi:parallel beta-helix repeat protein